MTRIVFCFLSCFAIVGCNTQPAAPTLDTSKTNLFGGVYEFEVEKKSGTNTSLTAHRTDDGTGKIEDLVDYEIGQNRIKIVNGALTLNDKKCGALQRGDKIRFTAAGKLYVNGVERGQ